ncbi:MAG: ABC transporter substrate-binding protein [Candidatus Thorarchaeota archaeon]
MNKIDNVRKMFLPVALVLTLVVMPVLSSPAQAANPGPFFSISILAPNTNSARNQWATLMVEQLPKIGIAVDVFDHTGWAQISPRTWGHPGPYPVPTYDEGGFDVLFVGWSWSLDWDPTGLFDTPSITPNGDNYYQYSNPEMDWAIGNYTQSFVLADRIEYAKDIQAILYEDVPEMTIVYSQSVYPFVEGFTGWDGLLWASAYQPMENWEIPGQTDFHYATPADFEDFLPLLYESVYDGYWLRQIYNGLVERDAANQRGYSPRLAESFSSIDGLTYNIELKSTAVWADGTPLTVDDVIYNFQLAVTPDLGGTGYSQNTIYWDNNSITKINDYEMSIEFLTPYVFQESNLDLDLIPKHIWESIAPADQASQAVEWTKNSPEKMFGAGPYMLEEFDATNQVMHLVVNPHFEDWSGITPKFTDIYFEFYGSKEGALSALASGNVDFVDNNFFASLDEINIPGVTYELVADPGTQEMGINMEHPYMGTGVLCPIASEDSARHIRKAINHIIPREIIVEEILNGIGTPGVTGMPNVAIGFDETLEPYEYSIDIALQHMKEAGFDITLTTEPTGLGLVVFVSILALAGASQVLLLKRKK